MLRLKLKKIKDYQDKLLTLLIFSALFLTVLVLNNEFNLLGNLKQRYNNYELQKSSAKVTPIPNQNIASFSAINTQNLSEDEKALLNVPKADASKEEKDRHYKIVVKLAQDGDTLDLNSCILPSPLDLRIKQDQSLKIINNDSANHLISIDKDHVYRVPAKQTLSFTIQFPYGPGAYGYLCDGKPNVVGFFLVPA